MDYNNCILVVLFFFVKQNMSEVVPFMGVTSFFMIEKSTIFCYTISSK